MKLNPDIHPIGKVHYDFQNGVETHYKVQAVHGVEKFAPAASEPLIVLVVAHKYAHPHQKWVTLPLALFVDAFRPRSEEDVFWVNTKQHQPEDTRAILENRIEITNDAPTTVRTSADYPVNSAGIIE